jgi:A/G-specific adenine glycosylase
MSAQLAEELLPGDTVTRIRRALQSWSRRNQRKLPWRDLDDPYRVWISEIMLQQTTVTAVIPYFERFVRRFPTVQRLAAAPEADVLKAWEGLGYYSRARNLHRAAQQVVAEHSGELPDSIEELQSLPGIGRYTAGAIASFAFGIPAPILEANTLRLYARLAGFTGNPHSSHGQRFLWEVAEQLVPARNPGAFNQALMDLGASVCRPVNPDCPRCPLKPVCRAFRDATVDEIPRPKSRPEVTSQLDACAIPEVAAGKRILLRRYTNAERWAGLWDFPRALLASGNATELERLAARSRSDPAQHRRIAEIFDEQLGLRMTIRDCVHELRHTVTRYRIHLICFRATVSHRNASRLSGEWRQATLCELDELPLTASARRIATVLQRAKCD